MSHFLPYQFKMKIIDLRIDFEIRLLRNDYLFKVIERNFPKMRMRCEKSSTIF